MSAGVGSVRYASAGTARNRLALGLTCLVHVLALFLFWAQQQRRPPDARTPKVVGVLLQLPAPAAVPRAPAPSIPPASAPRRQSAPAARPSAVPAAPAVTPAQPDPAPAEEAPAPVAAAPVPASGGFTMGQARRQAGRADRELRGGKSGVPLEADTPMARFRNALEAAHNDSSNTLTTDTYTSPDGTIYYRFRQGNQVRCRRTGGVGVLPQSMAEAGSAANVRCPSGAEWRRD
jgi:hypothetical protein